MTEVISVRFKSKGKIYFFDPNGIQVATGKSVVVETSKGLEFAECVQGNHMVEDTAVMPPLRPLVREATQEDIKRAEENRKKEANAFTLCKERIQKHGLDMKLVDVEYSFEGGKILFFFTADGRVDFRDLVKDLAGVFRTRIELRQIGVRDEARMLGGLGICGRPFCCAGFLDDFQPVSIKMAKTQGLSLNPTKISGTCGRLMCCLKYEQDAYEELVKNVPKVDSFVQTPAGKGAVIDVNLLRGRVKVRIDDQYDNPVKVFEASEVEVLGGKAKRAEFLAAIESGEVQIQKPASRLRSETRERDRAARQNAPAVAAPQQEEAVSPAPQGERGGDRRRGNNNRPRNDRPRNDRPQRQSAPQSPAGDAPQGESAGTGKSRQNRNSSPNRNRSERQPRQEARPAAEAPAQAAQNGAPQRYRPPQRQQKPEGAAPAPQNAGAGQNGGEETRKPNHRNHRYRNYRGGKPRQGGGEGSKSE